MLKKARSFREKIRKGAFNSKATNSASNLKSALARSLSISGRDDKKQGSTKAATPETESKPTSVTGRPTSLADDRSQLLAEPLHPVSHIGLIERLDHLHCVDMHKD